MAGISRSVTLTIAYIMAYFNMSMQDAYQYVKDKRPAISPNLNFMGQLVEFERHCQDNGSKDNREISKYNPTRLQETLSKRLMEKLVRSGSTVSLTGKSHVVYESSKSIDKSEPDGGRRGSSGGGPPMNGGKPFILKPLNPKKKSKKSNEPQHNNPATAPGQTNTQSPPGNNTSSNSNDVICEPTPPPPSSRPKSPSPRQVVVLSVKGEKLNLQNRRSPSPAAMSRSTSPPATDGRSSNTTQSS